MFVRQYLAATAMASTAVTLCFLIKLGPALADFAILLQMILLTMITVTPIALPVSAIANAIADNRPGLQYGYWASVGMLIGLASDFCISYIFRAVNWNFGDHYSHADWLYATLAGCAGGLTFQYATPKQPSSKFRGVR